MRQDILDTLTGALAETMCSALLVLLGCMGCVEVGGWRPNHLTICIGFGLAVMLILNIFGVVSGGHITPVVTVAAVVYKLINIPTAIAYVIGQFIGAYFAYGLLRILTPSTSPSMTNTFCMTLPGEGVHPMQAFGVEFFITMAFILMVCGVWDPRNAKHHDSVPLRLGLAITMLALVGGPYSGASMNPARSFGPAMYNSNLKHYWIYLLAPVSSSYITAVVYRSVFYREVETKQDEEFEDLPMRDKRNRV